MKPNKTKLFRSLALALGIGGVSALANAAPATSLPTAPVVGATTMAASTPFGATTMTASMPLGATTSQPSSVPISTTTMTVSPIPSGTIFPDREVSAKLGYVDVTTGKTATTFESSLPEVVRVYFPDERFVDIRPLYMDPTDPNLRTADQKLAYMKRVLSESQFAVSRLEAISSTSLQTAEKVSVNGNDTKYTVTTESTDPFLRGVWEAWNKSRVASGLPEVPINKVHFLVTSQDKLNLCDKILVEDSENLYPLFMKLLDPVQRLQLQKAEYGSFSWIVKTANTNRTAKYEMLGRAKQTGDEIRINLTEDQVRGLVAEAPKYCSAGLPSQQSPRSDLTRTRASFGGALIGTSVTIPKYNRRHVKVGEKTLTDSVGAAEIDLDAIVKATGKWNAGVYGRMTYDNNQLGVKGMVGPVYGLGNVGIGTGLSGISTDGNSSLGTGARLIWAPLNGTEIGLSAIAYGFAPEHSKELTGSFRADGRKWSGEIRIIGSYNNQATPVYHVDLGAKGTFYIIPKLGVYAQVGTGKLIGGPGVKESEVRAGAGAELRLF